MLHDVKNMLHNISQGIRVGKVSLPEPFLAHILALSYPQQKFIPNTGTREYFPNFDKSWAMHLKLVAVDANLVVHSDK